MKTRQEIITYLLHLPFPIARPVKKTKSIIAILAVLVPSEEMSDM